MELKGEQLKEYMFVLLSLLQEERTLSIAKDKLEWKLQQLQQKPAQLPEPERKIAPKGEVSGGGTSMALAIMVMCLGLILGLVTIGSGAGRNDNIWLQLLGIAILLGSIPAAIFVWSNVEASAEKSADIDREMQQETNDKIYQKEREQYEQRVAECRAQCELEIQELWPDLEKVKEMYNRNDALLQKVCALDVVDADYQGIVPVASFLHYLKIGICEEMKGPSGCYALYRQEAIQGIIITQLDKVIKSLHQLTEQQTELKRAILNSNDSINRLTAYVIEAGNEMQQHQEILEHNQKLIQDEMKTQHTYERLRDWLNS